MLKIKCVFSGSKLPHYATPGSAGLDLRAFINKPITLNPLGRALIPTGLKIALPPGYEAQIRPRSGLALKNGLSIPNAPGTIDSDYRGDIGVILVNLSHEPQTINPNERIAQLVIAQYVQAEWDAQPRLDETSRGHSGFGSTGKK